MDECGHWQIISAQERSSSGILDDWLEKIASGQRLATPSIVVRRGVYEKLGAFDNRMVCAGEDWEMWVRVAAHYPVWFESEPLALYRVKRPGSLTQDSARTVRLVRDMRQATDLIASYLPEHLPEAKAQAALQRAGETYAKWALEAAAQACAEGDWSMAWQHIQEALRCSQSLPIRTEAARIALHEGMQQAWRKSRRILGRVAKVTTRTLSGRSGG
jgi:hypothetical protein